jgi:peptidylprolyl isomerase
VVEDGKTIQIEYTLKLDDGTVADSSEGREPLEYEQGASQILPALEAELAGMQVGEARSVDLTAEQGYGAVDDSLLQEVPLSAVPEDGREAGAQLMSEAPDGSRRVVRVREVREDVVLIDLNHPLAGQALHFDVKVVGVE